MLPLVLKGTINSIPLEYVHEFVQYGASDIRLLLCCWCVIVLTLWLSSCLSFLHSHTHAPCFSINNSSFSVDFPLPHRKTNVLLQDKQRGERGKEMMTHQKERTGCKGWSLENYRIYWNRNILSFKRKGKVGQGVLGGDWKGSYGMDD